VLEKRLLPQAKPSAFGFNSASSALHKVATVGGIERSPTQGDLYKM
jgi:hypothetical protein